MNKDDRGMNHDSRLRNSLLDNWVLLNTGGVVETVTRRASTGAIVEHNEEV